MADSVTKVLTEATSFDLLTLDEAKLLLGLSLTDTSHDGLLTMQITIFSLEAANIAKRTFARQEVIETWREMYDGRVFLTQYPVMESDIESVSAGSKLLDPGQYELEKKTGKLSFIANPGGACAMPWVSPVVVRYTGGYDLPDEAPMDLKQAAVMLIRDERMRQQQAQVAGIRQISHKESRVAFFDPNLILARLATAKTSPNAAVEAVLRPYMHIYV